MLTRDLFAVANILV